LTLRLLYLLARRAPFLFKETREDSSFIRAAQDGRPLGDSLRQKIRVEPLRRWIAEAGFAIRHEELRVTGFFKRALPGPLRAWLAARPWVQDVMIGHLEFVLEKRV
jgi:hypothetical protein